MSGGKGASKVNLCDLKGKIVEFVNLLRTEAGGNPDVLFQRTSRVIIRGGVPLEVVHQLGDGLFHLQRHGCHNMLLYTDRFSGHRYSCRGNRQEGEQRGRKEDLRGKKRTGDEATREKNWGGGKVLVFFLLVFQSICGMCSFRLCGGKHQVHQGCRKKKEFIKHTFLSHSHIFTGGKHLH